MVEHLLSVCDALDLVPNAANTSLWNMHLNTFKNTLETLEAEAGGWIIASSRPAWDTKGAQGQPGLHSNSDPVLKRPKKKNWFNPQYLKERIFTISNTMSQNYAELSWPNKSPYFL